MSYFVDVFGKVLNSGIASVVRGPLETELEAKVFAADYLDIKIKELVQRRETYTRDIAMSQKPRYSIGDRVRHETGNCYGAPLYRKESYVTAISREDDGHFTYRVDFGLPGSPRIWFGQDELVKVG